MTYAQLVGVAFIGMFALSMMLTVGFVAKRPKLFNACAILAFICALGCVFFGVDLLLSGWTDPFSGTDTTKASASHGGKGGFFILLIRFWPYALIGLGCWVGYNLSYPIRRIK